MPVHVDITTAVVCLNVVYHGMETESPTTGRICPSTERICNKTVMVCSATERAWPTTECGTERVYPTAKTVCPDSERVYPTSKTVCPDSERVYPTSKTVYPDSERVYPTSKTVYPDSERVYLTTRIIPKQANFLPSEQPDYPRNTLTLYSTFRAAASGV